MNNLSRLTALLLALTIFLSSVAWADPVAEGDYTADNYAEQLAAQTGTCEICVMETEFPTTDHNGNTISITCGYEYLENLGSPMERYLFLNYHYEQVNSGALSALYSVHTQHVEAGAENLWCNCAEYWSDFKEPGAENHLETCPWVDGTIVIIPDIPQPPVYGGDPQGKQYTSNEEYNLPMANDRAIILPEGGRAVIHSNQADGYQWQVYDGTQWVSIQGETSADLVVTTAKLATIFDLTGIAEIRYFDVANDIVKASVSVTSQEIAGGEYVDPVEEAQTLSLIERADNYTITINYSFSDGEAVTSPYTASIQAGTDFTATVNNPTVVGYKLADTNDDNPIAGFTYTEASVAISVTGIAADMSFTVVYVPTTVNFTVIHYAQNVDDDNYTEAARETMTGLTKDMVPEVALDKRDLVAIPNGTTFTPTGFYSLIYEQPAIAADGSTIVEVYYDRNYYLLSFDLDGGYGVEPVYARYGKALDALSDPKRDGYTFDCWVDAEGNELTTAELPTIMPAKNNTYTAKWIAGNTKYTVVYWRENADDTNYSYWGSVVLDATSGTVVSGADDVPTSVSNATVDGETVNEKQYFTFNAALTDKNVEIKGDGTTVVNVYYYRNVYTIYFTGISGTCAIPEHTHTTACDHVLNCVYGEEHTHDANCGTATRTCGMSEHTHTHGGTCITISGATISTTAVTDRDRLEDLQSADASDNGVYRVDGRNRTYYVEYNGSYYQITSGVNDQNYSNVAVNYCELTAHTHTDTCNTYSNCTKVSHTHTDSCYRDCTKLEHTCDASCDQSRDDNVIWVVSAKYNATITNWPTADNFSNVTLQGWYIDGHGNTQAVSKRVNMTSDLCDTSDGLKYAEATTGGTKQYLYYMFESFDQENPANGNERKLRNGVYYDKSELYYQEVNASGSWSPKEIMGMSPVSNNAQTDGSNIFFYYTRNRYTITYQNITDDSLVVSHIMYEQPLKNYTFTEADIPPAYASLNGKLLSSYIPTYPNAELADLYVFKGWYTTAECFDGTEFNFDSKMPAGNITLFAKWESISRTVQFYTTVDDIGGTKYRDDVVLPHNTKVTDKVGAIPDPTNGNYTFVGWFYYELDGNGDYVKGSDGKPLERAIDFDNMPITANIIAFGKWSSNTLRKYTVYYKLQGTDTQIADPTTGSGLAGTTKTFDAKGDELLYPDYREGYFPVVKSHSLTLNIEHENNEGDNTFTFWYIEKPAVPYIVKYINTETGDSVFTVNSVETTIADKNVVDNRKAVVTETFQVIQGYMPDAYQKRLVVTADEAIEDIEWITVTVNGTEYKVHPDNVLTFYYTKDELNAYYKVSHWLETVDGTDFTEYGTGTQAPAPIGTKLKADDYDLTLDGYEFKIDLTESVVGTTTTVVKDAEVELTNQGLELKLYYVRKVYPYEIRYLEENTNKVLADASNGTAKYGATIKGTPKSIDGYEFKSVNPQDGTITINVEENATVAQRNIITYYYVEKDATIQYRGVAPDGAVFKLNENQCGVVSDDEETVKVMTGSAQGASADANDLTYKFVGWYLDENCTIPVPDAWITATNHITPQKTKDYDETLDGEKFGYEAATYYAKFEYNLTSMSITKKGMSDGESAIFTVTNAADSTDTWTVVVGNGETVTIYGLTVGATYNITEDGNWSWRYDATKISPQSKTIDADPAKNVVEITNVKTNDQWLSDEGITVNFDSTEKDGVQ